MGCEGVLDAGALEVALRSEAACGVEIRCTDTAVVLGRGAARTSYAHADLPVAARERVIALLAAERARVSRALRVERPLARAAAPMPAPPPRRANPAGLLTVGDLAGEPRSPLLGAAVDVRSYFDPVTPLLGPTLTARIEWLAVEAGASFAIDLEPAEGAARIALYHASVGAQVLCAVYEPGALCLGAFATLGYTRVDAEGNPSLRAISTDHVYAGGHAELGGWLATEWIAVHFGLRAGWGYGVVARAVGQVFAAVAGPWIGAQLEVAAGPFR